MILPGEQNRARARMIAVLARGAPATGFGHRASLPARRKLRVDVLHDHDRRRKARGQIARILASAAGPPAEAPIAINGAVSGLGHDLEWVWGA